MSKHTEIAPETVASTLSSMADKISSPVLGKAERARLRARNANVPDQLVEMISHLAEQSGGHVLGMSFDPVQARAAIAQAKTAQTQISVARQLLQRMEDDMVQQRSSVADPSFAIFTALRRLVNTKTGNALAPAYAQMKAIVKDRPRKPRKSKAAKSAASTVATTTAHATTTPPAQAPATKAGATTTTSA